MGRGIGYRKQNLSGIFRARPAFPDFQIQYAITRLPCVLCVSTALFSFQSGAQAGTCLVAQPIQHHEITSEHREICLSARRIRWILPWRLAHHAFLRGRWKLVRLSCRAFLRAPWRAVQFPSRHARKPVPDARSRASRFPLIFPNQNIRKKPLACNAGITQYPCKPSLPFFSSPSPP